MEERGGAYCGGRPPKACLFRPQFISQHNTGRPGRNVGRRMVVARSHCSRMGVERRSSRSRIDVESLDVTTALSINYIYSTTVVYILVYYLCIPFIFVHSYFIQNGYFFNRKRSLAVAEKNALLSYDCAKSITVLAGNLPCNSPLSRQGRVFKI